MPTRPSALEIRLAAPRDRAEWQRMRTALWPHAAAEHAREIDELLASADGRDAVFVAERTGGTGLSGFLELRVRDRADGCSASPVAYVEGWYVDPDCRRAGVAAALLEACESWSRSRGLRELASDAELGNALGQRAHRANGFEEVGRVVQFHKSLEDRG